MLRQLCLLMFSLTLFAVSGQAQEMSSQSMGQNVKEMKFAVLPGLPSCSPGSVLSGDPSKEGSIILAKIPAGCSIPWHWHTPTEQIMLVNGVARLEMKDQKPITLRAGGFARLPSHHVHQFTCEQACLLYIHSDGALDIHYVNAQGTEIPPAEVLKPMAKRP